MDIVDIYAVNAIIQILKERMKEIYFTSFKLEPQTILTI